MVTHADQDTQPEEELGEQPKNSSEGYHVFNDVSCKNLNIVVLGPGEVFVVETRSHWRRVTAAADRL